MVTMLQAALQQVHKHQAQEGGNRDDWVAWLHPDTLEEIVWNVKKIGLVKDSDISSVNQLFGYTLGVDVTLPLDKVELRPK